MQSDCHKRSDDIVYVAGCWRRNGYLFLVAVLLTTSESQLRAQAPPRGPQASTSGQLFYFEPETPERLLNACIVADRLQRPLDARRYLRKLLEPNTTREDLISLREKFGIGPFLALRANPELHPEAAELLAAVNSAMVRVTPSAEQLRELVQQLGADGKSAESAVLQLRRAGNESVPALLAADPDTRAGELAGQMLQRSARELRNGLTAALPTLGDSGRVRVLGFLGATGDPELIPQLLRWQFAEGTSSDVSAAAQSAIGRLAAGGTVPHTSEDAVRLLLNRVRNQLHAAGSRFYRGASAVGRLTSSTAVDKTAGVLQLAQDAVLIAPGNAEAAVLLLACQFAGEAGDSTADIPDVDSAVDEWLLVGALTESLEVENAAGAVGALRRLLARMDGSTGSSSGLISEGVTERLLHSALRFSDVRVRLHAALLASRVLGYSQSGEVKSILKAVRNGQLLPEAVVIDADGTRAAELTEALQDAGYAAAGFRTGIQGFEAAAHQLNCELILIHSNCIYWNLSPTVANLRADARTRQTPIVVYGSRESEHSVISLASRYPGIWFLGEPVGPMTIAARLLLTGVDQPLLSEDERSSLRQLAEQAVTR